MLDINTLEQNTPEWLEFRRTKIGASDTPIILNISPFKTPLQLWKQKLGFLENETSFMMQRGHDLENQARIKFCQLKLKKFTPKVMVHPEYHWMMASFDGISDDGTEIVEIKCPGKEAHLCAVNGQVPDYYMPQLQHQMIVAGVKSAYYYSYDGQDGVVLKVEYDSQLAASILMKTYIFHQKLINFEMPEFTDRDYHFVDNPQFDSTATLLKEVKAEQKRLEAQETLLKDSLLEMCNGKSSKSDLIRIKHCTRKGSIDYSAIPELLNIDLEKYRKSFSEYYRYDML